MLPRPDKNAPDGLENTHCAGTWAGTMMGSATSTRMTVASRGDARTCSSETDPVGEIGAAQETYAEGA